MAFNLSEAKRSKAKLRLAIDGPSGSGKTYSALLIAFGLCKDWSKIAVIDTERESANLYEDLCGDGSKYLTGQIDRPFTPQKYIEAIKACESADVEVIIIDSLTHAWTAEGGMLDIHMDTVKKQSRQNSYVAWREVTPLHQKLVDAMLTSPKHIIATVRSKTEYAQEQAESGKTEIRKVGMKPIFREGLDYEMTIVFALDVNHEAKITKSRISSFPVNDILIPTIETGENLMAWLESGADAPKCTDCGADILGNAKASALEVAAGTARTYGRSLCLNCAKKAKELDYSETSKASEPAPDPLNDNKEVTTDEDNAN
jgi:hypothetical protein